jgi:hypothetical protein
LPTSKGDGADGVPEVCCGADVDEVGTGDGEVELLALLDVVALSVSLIPVAETVVTLVVASAAGEDMIFLWEFFSLFKKSDFE